MSLTRKKLTSPAPGTPRSQTSSCHVLCTPGRKLVPLSFINKTIYQAQGSRSIFSSTSLFLALKHEEETSSGDRLGMAACSAVPPSAKTPTPLTRPVVTASPLSPSFVSSVRRLSLAARPLLPVIVFGKHPHVSLVRRSCKSTEFISIKWSNLLPPFPGSP